MLRSAFCCLLLLNPVAVAAPVPKAVEKKDDPADLKKLHARVAEAVSKDNWTGDDTKKVEETVIATLAKLTKAAGVDDRPLPVAFKDLEKMTPPQLKAGVKNALVVGEDVKATSFSNCVVVVSGTAKATGFDNCIVIAREVRCTGATNSVVIADEYARATSWGGGKAGDCVVIAGERVRATSMSDGFVHVLRPGTGTPPADDGRREDLPVMMTSARGVTFFGPEEKLRFADKDCKWVELKSPAAK